MNSSCATAGLMAARHGLPATGLYRPAARHSGSTSSDHPWMMVRALHTQPASSRAATGLAVLEVEALEGKARDQAEDDDVPAQYGHDGALQDARVGQDGAGVLPAQ